MRRVLGGDDRDGDGGLLAAHDLAGIPPEGFRHVEIGSQEGGRVHHVRLAGIGRRQVIREARRQSQEFIRMEPERAALLRWFTPRCR